MTDDIAARARAALEGVTEGPWEVNREGWAVISSSSDSVLHGYFEGDCDNCCYPITAAASVAISIENVTFIAEARTLVPELLAEVEQQRSRALNAEAELAMSRDGIQVRPMTETESNLMTQVLDLRRERAVLNSEVERLNVVITRQDKDHDRAIKDWGENDEQMLAENARLAAEVERLEAQLTDRTSASRWWKDQADRVLQKLNDAQDEVERLRGALDRLKVEWLENYEYEGAPDLVSELLAEVEKWRFRCGQAMCNSELREAERNDARAEVERLRYDADWFTKQIQDALDPGGGDEWDADDLIELVRTAEGDADNWKSLWQQNTETAAQAMRERDESLAEVERLRGALESVAAEWESTASYHRDDVATAFKDCALDVRDVLRGDQ